MRRGTSGARPHRTGHGRRAARIKPSSRIPYPVTKDVLLGEMDTAGVSDLHPHIRRLVDAFGPRRTFWGTDLARVPCSYRECVTLFTEELPWLEGADLEAVMGRGVCEWLGWPLPGA